MRVWDVSSGKALKTLTGHTYRVESLSFSPDGLLASGSYDDTVRVWDVSSGTELKTLTGHTNTVLSVAWSRDGLLASGSWDSTIRVWDLTGIGPPEKSPDIDSDGGVTPENIVGESVVGGDPVPFLREPNMPIGYEYTDVALDNRDHLRPSNIPSHRADVQVLSIVYLSDDTVAQGSTHDSHDIRVWDIAKDELIAKLDGHTGDVTSLAHLPDSPDGAILASGSKDNTVRLWTRHGNNWTSKRIGEHEDDVTCLVYLPGNPDGATFASADADGKVHLWKWNGGRWESEALADHAPRLLLDAYRVESLAYNSTRKTLASRSSHSHIVGIAGKVILSKWNGNRWQSEQLPGVDDITGILAYSPDGTLALGIVDGTVVLDEGATARELKPPGEGPRAPISSLAYSPDGTTLASGSAPFTGLDSGHLILMDTTTSESMVLDQASITSLAYSPDGTTLASGVRGSQAVHIWDLAPSRGLDDIDTTRFPDMVSDVAFTANATYFILTPQFAKVTRFGDDTGVDYEECRMTLHFPKGSQFFLMPLQIPEAQRAEKEEEVKADFVIMVGTHLLGKTPKVGWVVSLLGVAKSGYDFLKASDTFSEVAAAEALGQVQIRAVPSGRQSGYPDQQEIPLVVLIESRNGEKITGIEFTIEQDYKKGGNSYTSVARGKWDLESAAAAPHAQPMSLADYPPFQSLPPEVQDYLLRYFGGIVNAGDWQVPEVTSLLPNYPNPFNPETWMPYQLAKPADVTLTIYDINGCLVRDLDLGHQRAGTYESKSRAAYWDGRNAQGEPVASGVYFYRLKAGDFSATRKMLIRK